MYATQYPRTRAWRKTALRKLAAYTANQALSYTGKWAARKVKDRMTHQLKRLRKRFSGKQQKRNKKRSNKGRGQPSGWFKQGKKQPQGSFKVIRN